MMHHLYKVVQRSLAVLAVCLSTTILPLLHAAPVRAGTTVILVSPDAAQMERLAAQEVRRYIYLRTGLLLAIHSSGENEHQGPAILVVRKDLALATAATGRGANIAAVDTLAPQSYWLKTFSTPRGPRLLIVGGDEAGTLYGAYRFAEHLGVRFYLHGDVLPDERTAWELPVLDDRAAPLFALRGIQPFHDFPEGPDWWNTDDYLAVIGQLPKLRMNFIGLHTYPEGRPNAEPTVWIGRPSDLDAGGNVKFSYPASYQNTLRGNWGYAPTRTSDFKFGSAQLFEADAFGCDAMLGACPQPVSPAACNEVFERSAAMLRTAFRFAHQLGVQTCVGTETPLIVPKLLEQQLKAEGKDPADKVVVRELYEGIFQRAAKAYPLDYYWLWTPETWTAQSIPDAEVQRTMSDLWTAQEAVQHVGAPFHLATCGWVLGPQTNRALFGKILPPDFAISCINRAVGNTPVDRGFAEIRGRSTWAIPWLEDDPGLTSPQFWAARMRRDAADALDYGCNGLMGIHWRTRVLAPNIGALAQAAWDQRPWRANPEPEPSLPSPRVEGPIGGLPAAFPNNPIAGTTEPAIYQTVRYDVAGYRLAVPNGAAAVTLQFCEPHYSGPAMRLFDVKLQSQSVITNLDIFAQVGQNRALDFTFANIVVTNGWLDVDFVPRVEYPSIAGITVRARDFVRKINCGGPACGDYAADPPGIEHARPAFPAIGDFYADWARAEFGPEVSPGAAAIFEKLDCATPRPCGWINGPGGIRPDGRPWEKVSKEYGFVDQFAALETRIKGAGARARYDYWLNSFQFMRANAQVNCAWAEYDQAMQKARAGKDATVQKALARELALPAREKLVRLVGEVYDHLLATVSTPGELGTVANWNQHILPDLLAKPGQELEKLLGEPLPASAQPAMEYRGPARIIVPTVRSSLRAGETLKLKVIILAEQPAPKASLHWRPLGHGGFSKIALRHVARGVYTVELPAAAARSDFEYYVNLDARAGKPVRFPPTAPDLNQTVIMLQ